MNVAELHSRTVQRLADEYRAKGYEVIAEPSIKERPRFLQDYQPDLILRGKSESVIIEVKVGTEAAHGSRLQPIAERVAAHPGWRFSLVVVNPEQVEQAPGLVDTDVLAIDRAKDQARRAKHLATEGMLDAAFLLLWSAVEAALRNVAVRAHLPIPSRSTSVILRELFSAGELSRAQFEQALKALPIRNSVVHGGSTSLASEDVETLGQLADSLFRDLEEPHSVDSGAAGES